MKAFCLATLCLLLFTGCGHYHGTWSKSDRGAWEQLDELIGNHEQAYYLKQWGDPVSRQEVRGADARGTDPRSVEELLWLWKPDGTGPSNQPGQGWELYLSFGHDKKRSIDGWRVGGYRSILTISDVSMATRRFEYRFGKALLEELGLLNEQHGIGSPEGDDLLVDLLMGGVKADIKAERARHGLGPNWRGRDWEIAKHQKTIQDIVEATFRADNAARNLHGRLATDVEVLEWLKEQAESVRSSSPRQRSSQGFRNSGASGQGGVLGGGFLGPITPNAYGPGMNADATGRPFIWQPDPGFGPADPFSQVQPNAYGPGVGMDQYGRPVRPACPPGWAGPC